MSTGSESLIACLRQTLGDLAAPGDPRYSEPEAWAAIDQLEKIVLAAEEVIEWHRENEAVPSLDVLLKLLWRALGSESK